MPYNRSSMVLNNWIFLSYSKLHHPEQQLSFRISPIECSHQFAYRLVKLGRQLCFLLILMWMDLFKNNIIYIVWFCAFIKFFSALTRMDNEEICFFRQAVFLKDNEQFISVQSISDPNWRCNALVTLLVSKITVSFGYKVSSVVYF